jgi:hypothetical protein
VNENERRQTSRVPDSADQPAAVRGRTVPAVIANEGQSVLNIQRKGFDAPGCGRFGSHKGQQRDIVGREAQKSGSDRSEGGLEVDGEVFSDDIVNAFINKWLVPALVDALIRDSRKGIT